MASIEQFCFPPIFMSPYKNIVSKLSIPSLDPTDILTIKNMSSLLYSYSLLTLSRVQVDLGWLPEQLAQGLGF